MLTRREWHRRSDFLIPPFTLNTLLFTFKGGVCAKHFDSILADGSILQIYRPKPLTQQKFSAEWM